MNFVCWKALLIELRDSQVCAQTKNRQVLDLSPQKAECTELMSQPLGVSVPGSWGEPGSWVLAKMFLGANFVSREEFSKSLVENSAGPLTGPWGEKTDRIEGKSCTTSHSLGSLGNSSTSSCKGKQVSRLTRKGAEAKK